MATLGLQGVECRDLLEVGGSFRRSEAEAVRAFVVPRNSASTTPERARLLGKTLFVQFVSRAVDTVESLPKKSVSAAERTTAIEWGIEK